MIPVARTTSVTTTGMMVKVVTAPITQINHTQGALAITTAHVGSNQDVTSAILRDGNRRISRGASTEPIRPQPVLAQHVAHPGRDAPA